MIAERPDLVRAIVKATLRGMQFVMADPARACVGLCRQASPSFKGKKELMKKILANYTERTYKGQSTIGAMDPERLAKLQHFYKAGGLHRGRSSRSISSTAMISSNSASLWPDEKAKS